jgi:hypothetical protein
MEERYSNDGAEGPEGGAPLPEKALETTLAACWARTS